MTPASALKLTDATLMREVQAGERPALGEAVRPLRLARLPHRPLGLP